MYEIQKQESFKEIAINRQMASVAPVPQGIDVGLLLKSESLKKSLKQRIQTHDIDGNGIISMEELLKIMEKEGELQRERSLLRKIIVALLIACLLVIAAVVGLTYAVVHLSKDTSVQSDVIVSKESNRPLSTGLTAVSYPLADWYKEKSLEKLNGLTAITVPYGDGIGMFTIEHIQLVPGKSIAFHTTTENVIVKVTENGVEVSGDGVAASSGRRLLDLTDGGFILGTVINYSDDTLEEKRGDGAPCAVNSDCMSGACGARKGTIITSTATDYECCKFGILTGHSRYGIVFCKGQTELGEECSDHAMCKTNMCAVAPGVWDASEPLGVCSENLGTPTSTDTPDIVPIIGGTIDLGSGSDGGHNHIIGGSFPQDNTVILP